MAGTFRGHTFNALMQPNAVDDRPLAFRSTLAPFGTYANPDGSESFGFAWPAAVTEPINALQRLAQNSYTEDGRLGIPDPRHPENLSDMETLLWTGFGSNALKGTAGAALRPLQQPTILEQYHAANNLPHPGYGYLQEPVASTAEDALRWVRESGPIIDGELLSDTGRPSLAGAAVAAENAPTTGITAYHGSPHDFNRFDLSKIGTGEGAQAYGHGLYFAENEGVANSYRRKLSQGYSDGIGMAREALMLTGGDFEKAIAHVLRGKDSYGKRWGNDPNRLPFGKLYDDAVRELRLKPEGLAPSGHMYQVKINASPEDFLDWDLPLSQQSEKVRDTVLSMVPENDRYPNSLQGKDAVLSLQASQPGKFLDRSEVSPMLREAGIPGIKYLDQMSRAAGDGSRNYVVFDDSLIEILKKYGLAGGVLGASSLFDFNTDQQY